MCTRFLWLAAVAGCGHSSPATPDAPDIIDSSPDSVASTLACTPTSATGQVVVDGPSAGSNVTFIVHDPAGAVLSRSAPMGANATMNLDVPSCGMVSVFKAESDGSRPQVMTWTDVQPGDHLVHLEHVAPFVQRDVTVSVPAQTGATGYTYFAACSSTNLTFASITNAGPDPITPHCSPTATSITVIASATVPTGQLPMTFATVPLAASGATTVTLPAFHLLPPTTISAHGATGFTKAVFSAFTVTPDVTLVESDALVNLTGTDATFVTGAIPGAGGFAIDLATDKPSKSARLVRSLATMPATIDVDASEMLPVPRATIDAAMTRPTVVWAAPASTAASSLFEVDISPNGPRVEWDLVAPPVPGSIQLPEMPVDLVPPGVPFLRTVGLVDMTGITSYNAGDILQLVEAFPPAGGQSRFSSLNNGSPTKPSFGRRHGWR